MNTFIKKKIVIAIHGLQVGCMRRGASILANQIATLSDISIHVILYGINRYMFYSLKPSIIIHNPKFIFNNRYRGMPTVKTIFFLRKKISQIAPNTVLSFGEY